MTPDLARHLRDLGLLAPVSARPEPRPIDDAHRRAVATGISARDPWWQRGEECPH